MISQARKAEDLAAAMAASKGLPAQADTDSSQAGLSVGAQGQYAPTVAGGQPRPIGMAPQPVPLASGLDMHGYALDDEAPSRKRWKSRLMDNRVEQEEGTGRSLCEHTCLTFLMKYRLLLHGKCSLGYII
ncbi:uncharacterized protein LOC120130748 [Hibiscus syriacus]|uniref:uncharacterized protein LOC120130748 n=1 Tax=Hibiscus syriacus TaxID=106335 RepID=UPI0019235981|nr:uncharacterized protein LOC120130748 [Hibiscus syriacus]